MSSAFEGLPKTPNLKLNKPGYDNVADIEALNENADILDAEIQGIKNTFVKSVNGINAGDGGNVDLGIIPIAKGGTGQTTASGVRNALGLGNTTGAVPIANGGTGATTASDALTNLGLSTAVTGASISGKTITLTKADGTTQTLTTQDMGAIHSSGSGWVRFNNGFQIIFSSVSDIAARRDTTITMPVAFKDTKWSFTALRSSSSSATDGYHFWQRGGLTTSTIKIYTDLSNGNLGLIYIAVGFWK